MAEVILPPPVIPRRRPRDEPEIIDVDLLDDEEIVITGYGRSQRRRLSHDQSESSRASNSRSSNREVIVLSDDEAEGSSSSRRSPGRRRRRFVSPSPPPMNPQFPPPLPSLAMRLMFGGGRPQARAPPPPPPPVIIPNANPFAFEAQMHPPAQALHPSPPVLPPRGAPVSQHQPVMGFGGAILAMNRVPRPPDHPVTATRSHDRGPPQVEAQRSRVFRFSDFSNWVTDLLENRRPPEPQRRSAHEFWPLADLDDLDRLYEMPSMDEMLAQTRQPKPTEVMWKPEYTHPPKPRPGYTYHFTPEEPSLPGSTPVPLTSVPGSSSDQAIVVPDDDSDDASGGANTTGPSSSKAKDATDSSAETGFTLVCVRCNNALVLPDENSGSVTEEDRKAKRVWGLRCGHVLDGRCIHSVMRPPPSVMATIDDKGKGKMRAISGDAKASGPPRRGKGKAGADELASEHDPKFPTLPGSFPEQPLIPENSMRSRLRPRHPRPDTPHLTSSSSLLADALNENLRLPLPRGRGARDTSASHPYLKGGRGKGRARKPVVLEDYEWECPVVGCARVHRSIHLKGDDGTTGDGWSMDPERGAIAMFI